MSAHPDGCSHRTGDRAVPARHRHRQRLGVLDEDAVPETGDYAFPAGLSAVRVDREQDTGQYREPNIWIIHRISQQLT